MLKSSFKTMLICSVFAAIFCSTVEVSARIADSRGGRGDWNRDGGYSHDGYGHGDWHDGDHWQGGYYGGGYGGPEVYFGGGYPGNYNNAQGYGTPDAGIYYGGSNAPYYQQEMDWNAPSQNSSGPYNPGSPTSGSSYSDQGTEPSDSNAPSYQRSMNWTSPSQESSRSNSSDPFDTGSSYSSSDSSNQGSSSSTNPSQK